MKGLSITSIGLREINECLNIFQTLRHPLNLDYLELAIGSKCDANLDYDNIPLIVHDSCLYKHHYRCQLNPLQPNTWYSYAEFINNHHVLAVSIHPPLKKYCSQTDLETALFQMQKVLQVPVYLEVMPSSEYWCSCDRTLIDFPLLLDVSHVNIWHRGNSQATQKTCLNLLDSYSVGAIHLSHNQGKADTHDLIPDRVWFNDYLNEWNRDYYLTYESLPVEHRIYQRLDKSYEQIFSL